MAELRYPPDLVRRRIRTWPWDIKQDRPGGPIRAVQDRAVTVVGVVLEQCRDGVLLEVDVSVPGWPFVQSFGSNPTFGRVWIKAPFDYEVVA